MGNLFRRAQPQQMEEENSMVAEGQTINIILREGVTKMEQQALMSRHELRHLF